MDDAYTLKLIERLALKVEMTGGLWRVSFRGEIISQGENLNERVFQAVCYLAERRKK